MSLVAEQGAIACCFSPFPAFFLSTSNIYTLVYNHCPAGPPFSKVREKETQVSSSSSSYIWYVDVLCSTEEEEEPSSTLLLPTTKKPHDSTSSVAPGKATPISTLYVPSILCSLVAP